MVETDETDETIIRLLQTDGRTSNREIARQLEVSEGTVRQRLKRLVEAGAIRLGTVTDPVRLGITSVAYVRLCVQPGRLREVLDALAAMDEVYFAAATLGEYNVIAVAGARDRIEFGRIVNDRISPLPGVQSTDVRDIIETYKHRFDIVRIK
jgi:Lrp/AsnC family transcriptional regulator, regulator for asnA, asnC and gidA